MTAESPLDPLLQSYVDHGVFTLNEARAAMDPPLPPVDGGDVCSVLTKRGAIPIENLELYFKNTNDDRLD